MAEIYEDDIVEWFFHMKDRMPLHEYLCENIVLFDFDKCKSDFLLVKIITSKSKLFIYKLLYIHHKKACLKEKSKDKSMNVRLFRDEL